MGHYEPRATGLRAPLASMALMCANDSACSSGRPPSTPTMRPSQFIRSRALMVLFPRLPTTATTPPRASTCAAPNVNVVSA